MPTPSPDWDLVTLKWAGTYLDGSPCSGSLTLTYNGGVLLDDDPSTPINIYPAKLTVPITTTSIQVDGQTRQVGYAEVSVPASNDPDIQGSGGTYSLTESLVKGGGRQNASFVADINAPGGVIWLNKMIPTTPVSATPLSVVYYSDFAALKARVDALGTPVAVTKASIGLGSVDNTSDAAKPVSTATATALASNATADRSRANHTGTQTLATISDVTTFGKSLATTPDAATARATLGAGTSNLTLGTTSTTAKAGNYAPTLADIPAGSTITVVYNTTTSSYPARPTARTDIYCRWRGPVSPTIGGTGAVNGIDAWENTTP